MSDNDNKRSAILISQAEEGEPLRFADASQQDFTGVYHRDNSVFLSNFGPQVLFTRPPQLGKSTLLAVADAVYSKAYSKQNPPLINIHMSTSVPADRKRFVFIVDFVRAGSFGDEYAKTDTAVFDCVKSALRTFRRKHPELENYLPSIEAVEKLDAGGILDAVSQAVGDFSCQNDSREELLVLVDEYDAPVRYYLLDAIGTDAGTQKWLDLKATMKNYCGFFSSCKSITSAYSQSQAFVWVAGVTPIALESISDFKPTDVTFNPNFANMLGYEEQDVLNMLALVDQRESFADKEMEAAHKAVKEIANRLYFVKEIPLFYTRVVNGLMKALSDAYSRRLFLASHELPPDSKFDKVPRSMLKVIGHRTHREIFVAVRELAAGRAIDDANLNKGLNLADVARSFVKVDDYLTLLVHLGAASVTQLPSSNGAGVKTTFRPTSAYHRQPFFKALVEDTLGYLMEMKNLTEIYASGERLVKDFMLTLPKSSMALLVKWAQKERSNHILELQFQGYVVGHLSDELLKVTQEDRLPESGRTDVALSNDNVVVVLELKQKPGDNPHTPAKMAEYHEQLKKYVAEHAKIENAKQNPRIVAGFVVAMYDNGTQFQVERTSYEYP